MSITVKQIIDWTRSNVLDDTEEPYLWENEELIFLLNRCYNELFKIPVRKDQTTTAIVQISLLRDVGVYAFDSRIIEFKSVRLQTNNYYAPLVKKTEEEMNATITNWRELTGTPTTYIPGYESGYLSVYPKFDNTGELVRDTMLCSVTRLPTSRFTTVDITNETVISELRDDWAEGLPDGIGMRAWLKPDSYTYMPQKAQLHKAEWVQFLRSIKRDLILLHKPAGRSIRPGTGIAG